MPSRRRSATAVLVTVCLTAGLASSTTARTRPAAGAVQQEIPVAMHASGTFEVKVTPVGEGDTVEGSALGRMSIDKQFHGDLEGVGKGEMLTAMTPIEGSAGYVAMERVSGSLGGRSGTFVLQHRGVMTRGRQELTITVVPDSATGQLAGLAGTMTITIADGKHSYQLDYTLPAGK